VSGGNWDDDEEVSRNAPTVTYGLEPFVFDPGPQPTQEELANDAERRVRQDKRFREALRRQKAAITAILQGCLEKVNGQLERGEAVCQKAHFPLLHPVEFEDLEAFARHDHFVLDLRIDKVDEALQTLVSCLFGAVWTNVHVENVTKAKGLERFNQALQERMTTLEHHLKDRSRQLSNCRYAYFLEITHLRNQLYIEHQEGDENFEPVEAYFFDPTEYLEEELRQQLNDKITLSVKVYSDKLRICQRRIADLELQLETVEALSRSREDDSADNCIQFACNKHGSQNVIDSLARLADKEIIEWAKTVVKSQTSPAADESPVQHQASAKNVEALRQALMQAGTELEEERALRKKAEEEIAALQREVQNLRDAAEAQARRSDSMAEELRANSKPKFQAAKSRVFDDAEEMDELRKQVAKLKLQLEKERLRAAEPPVEAKAKLDDYDEAQAILQEAHVAAGNEPPPEDTTLSDSAVQIRQVLRKKTQELENLRGASKEASRQSSKKQLPGDGEEEDEDPEERAAEFEAAVDAEIARRAASKATVSGTGCECEAQTNITAAGDSFYFLEAPETELEAAIRAELEDLKACAQSAYLPALGAIRLAQQPPKGQGSGRCSRGAFLRLFQGVRSRLARYDQLIEMLNSMRRAELQEILEGVHFLMESDMPDEDVGLRDAIFGKGITQVMLDESIHPLEFAAVVKRWSRHAARIIGHLVKSRRSILLDMHTGRRIFIPLMGMTPGNDGGTGGGLPARQKKDFSPNRKPLFYDSADVLDEIEEDTRTQARAEALSQLCSRLSPSRSPTRLPRSRSPARSPSPPHAWMTVEGQAAVPIAPDGSLGSFEQRKHSPPPTQVHPKAILVGKKLVPHGAGPRNRSSSSGASPSRESRTSSAACSPERRYGERLRVEVLERLATEADKWHALEEGTFDPRTKAAPVFPKQLRRSHRPEAAQDQLRLSREEAEELEAKVHTPMLYLPFGGEAAKEVEQRLRSAPAAGGGAAAVRGARPRSAARSSEAPRPGTAPAGSVTVGAWQPLTYGPAAADVDRGADRERQRWVELTTNGPIGPLPSWEYDQAMELQTRPVGGRYTAVKLRPEPPVDEAAIPPAPHPTPRPATSGGRIRPPVPAPPISRGRSAGALPAARAEAVAVFGLRGTGLPPPARLLQRSTSAGFLRGARG